MLKAMANFIRPAADRRTTRHTKSRSPPPPAELAKPAAHEQQQPPLPAPILTRRLSKTLLLPSRDTENPNAHNATPTEQPSPARAGTRKRSIAEVDTPNARPPFKLKQRRSHDELHSSANGETKKLHVYADDVQSGASTPGPADATHETPSAMVDKKSLRSKNPERKATELAKIFEDYETIIGNWEDGENTENSLSSDDQISIVDEPLTPAQLKAIQTAAAEARTTRPPPSPSHTYTRRAPFDYTPYANALPTTEDPLADSLYTKVHKKHEREEKASRIREKNDLQYKMSKAQPVLEELEGEDWHKVFVIDKSERDDWQPKRRHFIKELRSALAKQDALREVELEKKRKEKAKRAREKENPSSSSSEDEDAEDDQPKSKRLRKAKEAAPPLSHTKEPETPKTRRPPRPHGYILEWEPSQEKKDKFKSFYPKGQRPASLGGKPNPRATRSADAPPFGVTLPDILTRLEDENLGRALMEDNGFELRGEPTEEWLLPDEQRFQTFRLTADFITREFLAENDRKRRRRKRESAGKRREPA